MPDTLPLTVAPSPGHATFLYARPAPDLDALAADIAVLGIPYGHPYAVTEAMPDPTTAPAAVRAATERVCRALERYDFDVGGPIFAGQDIRMVDCGDVPGSLHDPDAHYRRAEQAVRKILAAGALPLIIGGDHGIPIPVLRAYDGRGPITVVQIDAHIDWRDEVNGVRDGYSSPMRRASELPHVTAMFQIGIRSQGSARAGEVAAAEAWGAQIITAWEVHDTGMDAVLARIPDGGNYYLTVDADGLDPAIAPGVLAAAPGGLSFHQARKLIHGLVRKGRVVGMDVVEIAPRKDVNNITAITAGRLFVNLIGAAVRAGYFAR